MAASHLPLASKEKLGNFCSEKLVALLFKLVQPLFAAAYSAKAKFED